MKRLLALPSSAAILLILLLASACGGGTGAQEEVELPTVVPARALTPAPPVPDDRRTAVMTLSVVSSADGEVEGVKLEQGQIINAYGPNVFGLAGPWTVELSGESTIRYGTLDPRRFEVEDEEDERGFTNLFQPDVTWDLVVPLSDARGNDLQVEEIRLFDQAENLIFSAAVRDEKLIPLDVQ